MAEVKPIPDFPGYFAGDDGVIYSTNKGSVLKPLKAQLGKSSGYLIVNLKRYDDSPFRVKSHLVHKLVLLAWHGPRPDGDYQGSHLNGDRTDCRPSNLLWETRTENEERKVEHGTVMRGVLNGVTQLSEDQVHDIRRLEKEGYTQTEIAIEYGISQSHVSDICRYKTWKHLVSS